MKFLLIVIVFLINYSQTQTNEQPFQSVSFYHNTTITLSEQIYGLSNFVAKSNSLFNCSFYQNTVLIKNCTNVMYCDINVNESCFINDYLVLIDAANNNNTKFILEYRWSNNSLCASIIITMGVIFAFVLL